MRRGKDGFGVVSITSGVCRAVAACIGGSGHPQILPADMIVLVWQRVKTAETRLLALMERVRLGRQRGGVVRAARAVVERAEGEPAGRAVVILPRRFGWLVAMVGPTAAVRGSQLAHLLDDPEMVALVRDVPQARRLLAPLCRMLGVEKCGVLALRPPVVRAARVRRVRAGGEAAAVPAMARPGYGSGFDFAILLRFVTDLCGLDGVEVPPGPMDRVAALAMTAT
eukprot:gene1806-1836_t